MNLQMPARPRKGVRAVAVLIVLALFASASGCILWPRAPADAPPPTRPAGHSATSLPPEAEWTGRNVTLAGRVVDNATGEGLANATLVVTLVSHPLRGGCPEDVLVSWATWTPELDDDGAFGPVTLPEPAGGGLVYRFLALGAAHREAILERRPADPTLGEMRIALDPAATLAFDVPQGAIAAWIREGAPLSTLASANFPGGATVQSLAAGRYHVVIATPGALPRATTVDLPPFGETRVDYAGVEADSSALAGGVVTFGNETLQGVTVVALDDAGRPIGIAASGADGAFTIHVGERSRLVASARLAPDGEHEGGMANASALAASRETGVQLALALPACRR